MLAVIRDWLDALTSKLRSERPYGTERCLKDVEAARAAVAQAMRTVAGGARAGSNATPANVDLSVDPLPQTETEAFKRWYGDWQNAADGQGARGLQGRAGQGADAGGKQRRSAPVLPAAARFAAEHGPVDGAGRVAVWHHGTADDFSTFDLSHPNRKDQGWAGTGVYLSNSEDLAGTYSNVKRGSGTRKVMALYANVRNPHRAGPEVKQTLKRMAREQVDTFTAELARKGHDGVLIEWPDGLQELVVFDPAQVKSATDNIGTPSMGPIRIST